MTIRRAAKVAAAVAAMAVAFADPASAAVSPTPMVGKWYNASPGTIKRVYASSVANPSTWPAVTYMNIWNNYFAVNSAKIRWVNVSSCSGFVPCVPIDESPSGLPNNFGVGGTTGQPVVNGYLQPGVRIRLYDNGIDATTNCSYAARATIVGHELGHALGLSHDPHADDLMSPAVDCGRSSTQTPSVYNMTALNNAYR